MKRRPTSRQRRSEIDRQRTVRRREYRKAILEAAERRREPEPERISSTHGDYIHFSLNRASKVRQHLAALIHERGFDVRDREHLDALTRVGAEIIRRHGEWSGRVAEGITYDHDPGDLMEAALTGVEAYKDNYGRGGVRRPVKVLADLAQHIASEGGVIARTERAMSASYDVDSDDALLAHFIAVLVALVDDAAFARNWSYGRDVEKDDREVANAMNRLRHEAQDKRIAPRVAAAEEKHEAEQRHLIKARSEVLQVLQEGIARGDTATVIAASVGERVDRGLVGRARKCVNEGYEDPGKRPLIGVLTTLVCQRDGLPRPLSLGWPGEEKVA
jgi:hypothetical protein